MNKINQCTHSMLNQYGISLVETLVSLAILSIGLLGLIALQTGAFRYNHDAQLRSIAVKQISSMADRMRANKAGVSAGLYNALTFSPPPTNPTCTTCTPTQIAQRDNYEWYTENRNLLPAGIGQVTGANGIFTIRVMWNSEKSTTATGTNCSGNLTVDLMCVQMNIRI